MDDNTRFALGNAGISVGLGAMTVAYLLDDTLLGPFTTIATVAVGIGAVGAAGSAVLAVARPEQFDFQRALGTDDTVGVTLVGGTLCLVCGLALLALAVL